MHVDRHPNKRDINAIHHHQKNRLEMSPFFSNKVTSPRSSQGKTIKKEDDSPLLPLDFKLGPETPESGTEQNRF